MLYITKTITKLCKSLTQAERYQNRLYNQFDSVQLVKAPRFTEEGVYSWEVKVPAPRLVEDSPELKELFKNAVKAAEALNS